MAWKGWENFDVNAHERAVRAQGNPGAKRNKYHATRTGVDGLTFDSKREAARWLFLKDRAKRGEITNLRRQVKFDLTATSRGSNNVGFQLVGRYLADFTYIEDGTLVVEDSKGMKTDLYRWKKRHFEIEYDREIQEV